MPDDDLRAEQARVLGGIVPAIVFMAVVIPAGLRWLPPAPLLPTTADRLAFWLRCDLFAVLALLAGVAWVANRRFFVRAAIGGEIPPDAPGFAADIHYLTNTTEQLLLLLPAHGVLALVVPQEQLHILPLLVALFLVGRLAFWIGYHVRATARAFGFATSFYPTVGVLLYDAYRVLAG